jgi:hypothetical protein
MRYHIYLLCVYLMYGQNVDLIKILVQSKILFPIFLYKNLICPVLQCLIIHSWYHLWSLQIKFYLILLILKASLGILASQEAVSLSNDKVLYQVQVFHESNLSHLCVSFFLLLCLILQYLNLLDYIDEEIS